MLTQVGTTLRTLFRSHDVIGRVGGDEFMVLHKIATAGVSLAVAIFLVLNKIFPYEVLRSYREKDWGKPK